VSQDYLKWRLAPRVRNLASETWEQVRKSVTVYPCNVYKNLIDRYNKFTVRPTWPWRPYSALALHSQQQQSVIQAEIDVFVCDILTSLTSTAERSHVWPTVWLQRRLTFETLNAPVAHELPVRIYLAKWRHCRLLASTKDEIKRIAFRHYLCMPVPMSPHRFLGISSNRCSVLTPSR